MVGKSGTTGRTAQSTGGKNVRLTRIRTSNAATNSDRQTVKGATHLRTNATIKRINMYRMKPKRDEKGKLISGSFMSRDVTHDTRIRPAREWFNNTRVVGQDQLEKFRTAMTNTVANPYTVLLRPGKIPFGLLSETAKVPRVKILETESFQSSFGPNNQRKRPKLAHDDYASLLMSSEQKSEGYDVTKDKNIKEEIDFRVAKRDLCFDRGHSKRLWGELYKVLDSSDVVIQVLDARDPIGTRSMHLEKHIRENAKHKHLVILLNKCDLVPPWVTAQWTWYLSREWPTVAFHASMTHPFGKGALIMLLRQFATLHSEKKQISIGFVGYPNVGKSSIINTLRSKKVCKVAPIPGETKVWQYVAMTKKINLIDCPGVVPPEAMTENEIVLRGVIRIENLSDPIDYIGAILDRVKPEYIARVYGIKQWKDTEDFLVRVADRLKRLLKKGEPDLASAAKTVLHDWQRGRLPYFTLPPTIQNNEPSAKRRRTTAGDDAVKQEADLKDEKDETAGAGEDQDAVTKEEGEADDDDIKEVTGDLPGVVQNFRKISVKLEYDDDDLDATDVVDYGENGPDWDELFDTLEKDEDDEIIEQTEDMYASDDEAKEEDADAGEDDDEEGADSDEDVTENPASADNKGATKQGGRGGSVRELMASAHNHNQQAIRNQMQQKQKEKRQEKKRQANEQPAAQDKKGGRKRAREEPNNQDRSEKNKRMATNKKKVVNFYTENNVKNRRKRRNVNYSLAKSHQAVLT